MVQYKQFFLWNDILEPTYMKINYCSLGVKYRQLNISTYIHTYRGVISFHEKLTLSLKKIYFKKNRKNNILRRVEEFL